LRASCGLEHSALIELITLPSVSIRLLDMGADIFTTSCIAFDEARRFIPSLSTSIHSLQ